MAVTGAWEREAGTAGVPRFALTGVVGGLAAREEHHGKVCEVLGVEPAAWSPAAEEIRIRSLDELPEALGG